MRPVLCPDFVCGRFLFQLLQTRQNRVECACLGSGIVVDQRLPDFRTRGGFIVFREHFCRFGVLKQTCARAPCLQICRAPVGADDSDGNIQFRRQFCRKEKADSRPVSDCFRRWNAPAPGDFVASARFRAFPDIQHPDFRG